MTMRDNERRFAEDVLGPVILPPHPFNPVEAELFHALMCAQADLQCAFIELNRDGYYASAHLENIARCASEGSQRALRVVKKHGARFDPEAKHDTR